jgi:hypothetical protein
MLPFIGSPGLVPCLFTSSGRIGVLHLDMSAIPDEMLAKEWVGCVKLNHAAYKSWLINQGPYRCLASAMSLYTKHGRDPAQEEK